MIEEIPLIQDLKSRTLKRKNIKHLTHTIKWYKYNDVTLRYKLSIHFILNV